jgi:hypothetical protein
MFFLDKDVDEKYTALRSSSIESLSEEMKNINSRAGLEEYIKKHTNSLDNLLVVLGISGEYFKRIVSMFRIQRGMEFQTEWSLSATRRFILDDEPFRNKVLDLFIEADENKDLRTQIPVYKLSAFKITPAVMGRLANPDFLNFLYSKEFDTSFNNEMSSTNVKRTKDILNDICQIKGYTLIRDVSIDPNGNNTRNIHANYAIVKPGEKLPSYYIKYAFILTTSKGQTSTKNEVKDIRDYIITSNQNAKQIMIIDGAGWIGRQNDLKDIWDYSNYCLNLAHLEQLKDIII